VFNIDEVGGVAGMVNNTITCERDTGSPTSNNFASNIITNELITCVGLYSPLDTFLSYAYASDYMPFEANNEIITGFFETNETPHRHTATDLLVNMDPNYVYNIAKAAIGATLHFAKASTVMGNQQLDDDFQVGFFTNPTTQILTINKGTISESRYTFSLIDIQGKTVMAQQIIDSQLIEQVNVSGLSKGIYLGVLETATHKITKKIVLQ
jgi:aminopeptidase YwaD